MKPHRLAVLGLITLLLMIGAPSLANAAAPVPASGSVTQTSFVITGARTADGITFFTFEETDTLTGTFTGTATLSGECIQRATGPVLCQAHETFTGTVLGRSGTLTFLDLISVDLATGAVEGRFNSLSGTGELSGIQTHGTFEAQGTTGTYSGSVVVAR
jgi:hypothetical protein